MTRLKDLKSKVISDINNRSLSEVLPSIIDFAEKTENTELRQLCIDELYGYETNAELPEYRNIPVDFYDKYGDKITRYPKGSIISISEAMQKEYYPYRGPIEALENLTIESGVRSFTALKEPFIININDKSFEAHSFEHIPRQIKYSILRLKKIINKSVNILENQELLDNDDSHLKSLHKNVVTTSFDLFSRGHYRQAVLDATIELVNLVKQKSSLDDLDNTPLIQKAFSPNNPILEVSKNKDLQLGFMWLFSGAVMTFRNVNAHNLNPNMTKNECMEQLNFLSYLHRVLDETKKNTTANKPICRHEG